MLLKSVDTIIVLFSHGEGSFFGGVFFFGGEAFFVVLQATPQWTELRLPLSEFQVDPDNRRDGKLQVDQLTEILIADPGAISEGADGSRRVWFSEWTFN